MKNSFLTSKEWEKMFYKLCLVAAFALFSLNAQAAQEAAAEAGGERVENDYYNCLQAASG